MEVLQQLFAVAPEAAKQLGIAVALATVLALPVGGVIDALKVLFPERIRGAATVLLAVLVGAFFGWILDGVTPAIGVLSAFIIVYVTTRFERAAGARTAYEKALLAETPSQSGH